MTSLLTLLAATTVVATTALTACSGDSRGVVKPGGPGVGGSGISGGTGSTGPEGGLGNLGGGPGGGLGAGGDSQNGSGGGAAAETGGLVRGNTMDCDDVGPGTSTTRVEAECAHGVDCGSGISGSQTGTELENGSTTVGYIEGGDSLGFTNVPLDGVTTINVRYAKENTEGSLEIRLGSASGTVVGTFNPSPTGGWESWSEGSTSLSGVSGTQTVYLVAAGTTEGILNLDWVEFSSGGSGAPTGSASAFHFNHLGFSTLGPKHVVVEGSGIESFSVVNASGEAQWCGSLTPIQFTEWGGNTYYSVDFTQLTEPGTYRLQVGGSSSDSFVIGDTQLYDETMSSVIGYFNTVRADESDGSIWSADNAIPFFGNSDLGTRNAQGGWYDASGDVSKYLTHLSYANTMNPQQIPLVVWAMAWVHDEGGSLGSSQASAARSEALWGADYLVRVFDPAGYFYTNVFDGWGESAREICAFEGDGGAKTDEWQSAMREGGGMSIAALARVASWDAAGSFSSAEYLSVAEAAFNHLDTNGAQYADDGTENLIDDYTGLLAASELYATTQTASYLEAARRRATSLMGRQSSEGYFLVDGSRPFWHASDAGLPVVALARYAEVETDEAQRSAAVAAIRSHLDYLLSVTSAVPNPYGYARQHTSTSGSSFFIPHDNDTGYWWQGENARLSSLAAAAMIGADAVGALNEDYLDLLRFAGHQVDWVLGSNPYDICFMHGKGRNNPPPYHGEKPEVGTPTGGISNGITGRENDGSGIQWMLNDSEQPWLEWRWVEQWLPHAAWYAVAVTAMERNGQ